MMSKAVARCTKSEGWKIGSAAGGIRIEPECQLREPAPRALVSRKFRLYSVACDTWILKLMHHKSRLSIRSKL
jgi:hypothetical protein